MNVDSAQAALRDRWDCARARVRVRVQKTMPQFARHMYSPVFPLPLYIS